MDAYLINRQKEILMMLLANPADTGHAYTANLAELVNMYPQAGLFHAMLGRAQQEPAPSDAAAWFSGKPLHKLFHHYTALPEVDAAQIIFQEPQADAPSLFNGAIAGADVSASQAQDPAWPHTGEAPELPVEPPEIWNLTQPALSHPSEETAVEMEAPETIDNGYTPVDAPEPELTVAPAFEEEAAPAEPVFTPANEVVETGSRIEDEIYDEITGIDEINIPDAPKAAEEVSPDQAGYTAAADADSGQPIARDESRTNYFVFDRDFDDAATVEEETPNKQMAVKTPDTQHDEGVHYDLSKYHDEQMPYTFMWWLDKTRKEHSTLYQPYTQTPAGTAPKKEKSKPDELQQQYYENIFHITSADEFTADTATQGVTFDMQNKEDRIIQRFITEDPHIHPPTGEKLDTENKARKSAEDAYEMVTETLAKIYTDQMLYPKAIATYKKLMLKFPEKSSYFASLIQNLERKTN